MKQLHRNLNKIQDDLDNILYDSLENEKNENEYSLLILAYVLMIAKLYTTTLNSHNFKKLTKAYFKGNLSPPQKANLKNISSSLIAKNQDVNLINDFNRITKRFPATSRTQYRQLLNRVVTSSDKERTLNSIKNNTQFTFKTGSNLNYKVNTFTEKLLRDRIRDNNNNNCEQIARSLDIDVYQVSTHSGARPLCSQDQGQLFSDRGGKIKNLITEEVLEVRAWSTSTIGEPAGLFGNNCRHIKFPFVEGVDFDALSEDMEKTFKSIRKGD